MSILKDYAQAMVNFAKARDVAATTELAAERDAADAYLESKKIDAMKEAKDANARAGQATEAATNSSRGS